MVRSTKIRSAVREAENNELILFFPELSIPCFVLRAPYFIFLTQFPTLIRPLARLFALVVLRPDKQRWTRLAGGPLIQFPDLIGPVGLFAEMLGS